MKTPVLLIHGMCCTGEVWGSFRAFFEGRGTRVYTPTLRPELRTSLRGEPQTGLPALRLADYVSDLVHEAKRIEAETGRKPAVIGHSMGGLLAQALAERDCVSAAVWISPAPDRTCPDLPFKLFWFGVLLANALRVAPPVVAVKRKKLDKTVFNQLPEVDRTAAYAGMVYESGPAFADMGRYIPNPRKVRVPVLTVAASRDRLIPPHVVRLVAQKYAAVGGEFREYSGHGHWLYTEPGWERTAGELYAWLAAATQYLAASEPAPRAQPGLLGEGATFAGSRVTST